MMEKLWHLGALAFVLSAVGLSLGHANDQRAVWPADRLVFNATKEGRNTVNTGEVQTIKVNNVRLDAKTIQELEHAYRTRLVSGNFWYDPVSGLWGVWGGPAFGQIAPGLKLSSPLPFAASGGQTDIVINGRAIHPLEYQYIIATYGYAIPGRYWLDARGNVGVENGSFLFNVYVAGWGQGGRSWYRAGLGGYMGSDGKCIGYTAPGGETFMTGC